MHEYSNIQNRYIKIISNIYTNSCLYRVKYSIKKSQISTEYMQEYSDTIDRARKYDTYANTSQSNIYTNGMEII